VIVGRAPALGAVGSRDRALQIRPEYLEIDDGVQPLQIVALGRKVVQPLVDVENSRLPAHRFISASIVLSESKRRRNG
jgi:hypothetical protein